MAKGVQAQWRGFTKAIVIGCLMLGIGMWSLGWMDRDVDVVGGDLLRGIRSYLGIDSKSVAPPPAPEIFHRTGNSPLPSISTGASGLGGDPEDNTDKITMTHQDRGAIVGRVSVIDGDTIEMHGKRIRLWGIDAPESAQQCEKAGKKWLCGAESAKAMQEFIRQYLVACYDKGRDKYDRMLGQCFVGQIDINGWSVKNGWSYAYRQYTNTYASRESMARFQSKGVWQDKHAMKPWEWRRLQNGERH